MSLDQLGQQPIYLAKDNYLVPIVHFLLSALSGPYQTSYKVMTHYHLTAPNKGP